jgi:hypothetical protein
MSLKVCVVIRNICGAPWREGTLSHGDTLANGTARTQADVGYERQDWRNQEKGPGNLPSPILLCRCKLEVQLRAQLYQPTRIYGSDLAKAARLYILVDAGERSGSIAELRMVKQVVAFEAQL